MKDTRKWQQDRASEPMHWYNQATNLRAAAGALHYCSDDSRDTAVAGHLALGDGFRMSIATWQPYLLLCGLSLELLLKAAIVAHGNQPKETHDLQRLANDAGVQFTEEQHGALEILTNCVIWYGKYSAPNQKHHGALADLASLGNEHLTEQVPGVETNLRRHRKPHPLKWGSFERLWNVVHDAFWTAREEG